MLRPAIDGLASPWRVWLHAARPPTLPAAVVPVLVGTALAVRDADLRVLPFLAALGAALLLQIGANFANDVADFARGADRAGRLGPTRVTQAGLVSPPAMRRATLLAFGLAALIGIYLIAVAGWPILVVGATGIVAALAYTGGPWPYGYHGLGEPFVFLFFGLVAVLGSVYVQVEELSGAALAAAPPVGLIVTAILVVNNLRDLESDRASGKRTIAVRIGERATRAEYALLIAGAYVALAAVTVWGLLPWWAWLTWLSAPLALALTRRVLGGAAGDGLNGVLKQTGRLHLAFGLLLAIGVLV